MKRLLPDAETLKKMYVDQDMTPAQISRSLNLTVKGNSIWKALRRAGVKTRPTSERSAIRVCEACGVNFKVRPFEDTRNLRQGHRPRRFCSRECVSKNASDNPKWRGGTFESSNGYIYEYAPDHPLRTKAGYVMQHRLVMEKVLGRYLTREEEVHHKNHVKSDNSPDNLELMVSKSEHMRHHGYYEPASCGTCGKAVQRSRAHRKHFNNVFCSRTCAAANGSKCAARKS